MANVVAARGVSVWRSHPGEGGLRPARGRNRMPKRQGYGTAVKLVCLLSVLGCARVWAWGNEGHETIGAIADTLLTGTPAAQHLQRILSPGETLATATV